MDIRPPKQSIPLDFARLSLQGCPKDSHPTNEVCAKVVCAWYETMPWLPSLECPHNCVSLILICNSPRIRRLHLAQRRRSDGRAMVPRGEGMELVAGISVSR
jgi:hypothetical protein